MNKMIKVWFPDFYTEAHRTRDKGIKLAQELVNFGVRCQEEYDPHCDFVLCGSIYKSEHVRRTLAHKPFDPIPVIQYNWDIYPWSVEQQPNLWLSYIKELQKAVEIWVPSQCTAVRTREITGRHALYVVKTAIHPFEAEVWDGGYVVDVMRKYPDPNQNAVREACESLGIQCVETKTTMPRTEFEKTIAGARLLVSAYYEASTGGLTLLEGHYLGKPCLLSNSPYNGAVDYFDYRAEYLDWSNKDEMKYMISECFNNSMRINVESARKWVDKEYSDKAMAERMAVRFKELSNGLSPSK